MTSTLIPPWNLRSSSGYFSVGLTGSTVLSFEANEQNDIASCESIMKTLKREEIYANRHEDIGAMRAKNEEFIEQYYNRQRGYTREKVGRRARRAHSNVVKT